MAKSLFDQLTQVRGTRTFDSTMYNDYAEQCGRDYDSGTMSTTSGSATMNGSGFSNDFEKDEVGNYVVIDSGDAAGVYEITAVNSTTQVTVSPVAAGTDGTAATRLHFHKNLEDDLNYLRYQMDNVIGETNWYDDPCSDIKSMCYLIPKRPNYVGETGQYADRPGTVSWASSDIDQLGSVSSGNTAAYYTDNTSTASNGDSMRFTDDNSMVISITGGFYPADSGYLRIYQDGLLVGELDLAAAWTSDGCSYETEEADVGTNPDYTASNTGTDIINLTARRCMNDSTDSYGYFWPPYQMASMSATLNFAEGYKGQIYIQHTSGGGAQNYTYSEFWVDTTAQSITAGAPTIVEATSSTRYLSGVPYYDSGSTFTISGSNSDSLFEEGYPSTPARFNVSEFNESNITLTYPDFGLSTPLDITDDLSAGASKTITVGASNHRDLDARATMTLWNVFASAVSSNSAAGTFRIDTTDNSSDSDTVEPFNTEERRMLGNEDFTDITVDETDSNWVSSTSIITTSGCVVYNGTLKYPGIDHSAFLPAGPDYSSASGDFTYYRVFEATGAFTNGTITFSGWSNAKTEVEGSNVDVYLRLPNCTDYGNGNNGDVWQDLAVDQQTFGGDGCQGSGSTGSVLGFSFGSTSSSSYGNRIVMKIVMHNSSATTLTGITFSPTL